MEASAPTPQVVVSELPLILNLLLPGRGVCFHSVYLDHAHLRVEGRLLEIPVEAVQVAPSAESEVPVIPDPMLLERSGLLYSVPLGHAHLLVEGQFPETPVKAVQVAPSAESETPVVPGPMLLERPGHPCSVPLGHAPLLVEGQFSEIPVKAVQVVYVVVSGTLVFLSSRLGNCYQLLRLSLNHLCCVMCLQSRLVQALGRLYHV